MVACAWWGGAREGARYRPMKASRRSARPSTAEALLRLGHRRVRPDALPRPAGAGPPSRPLPRSGRDGARGDPPPEERSLERAARAPSELARKRRGSRNRAKARQRIAARIHRCACGMVLGWDENAARVMLNRPGVEGRDRRSGPVEARNSTLELLLRWSGSERSPEADGLAWGRYQVRGDLRLRCEVKSKSHPRHDSRRNRGRPRWRWSWPSVEPLRRP